MSLGGGEGTGDWGLPVTVPMTPGVCAAVGVGEDGDPAVVV